MSMIPLLLLLVVLAAAAAETIPASSSIPANSDLGRNLLSVARRVDGGNEDENENMWMLDYSLVFQGCYSIKQWNDNADENNNNNNNEVFIYSRGLVRFRLCPKRTCSLFCVGGHGDYIVDLATFVQAYVESKRRDQEIECQTYLYEKCDCEDNDYRDDGFNPEYCEYNCFVKGRKSYCIDRDPYEDDEAEREEEFDVGRYMECNEFEAAEFDDDDDGYNYQRQLNQDGDDGIQYYVGPYCSKQGGDIFIGMFTDDTCTNFADDSKGRSTYKNLTRGQELPYATKSVVNTDCISCLAPQDPNRQDEDNNYNGYNQIELSEVCERVYQPAGKCEKKLKSQVVGIPNNNACNFIDGIKITRKDGFIYKPKRSAWATFFIVLFATTFCAFAFYVWYLRKKLSTKRDTLL